MSNDVQFLVECLSTELVSMLMDTYGWDMKRALDEYMLLKHTKSSQILNAVYTIKVQYMYFLFLRMRLRVVLLNRANNRY